MVHRPELGRIPKPLSGESARLRANAQIARALDAKRPATVIRLEEQRGLPIGRRAVHHPPVAVCEPLDGPSPRSPRRRIEQLDLLLLGRQHIDGANEAQRRGKRAFESARRAPELAEQIAALEQRPIRREAEFPRRFDPSIGGEDAHREVAAKVGARREVELGAARPPVCAKLEGIARQALAARPRRPRAAPRNEQRQGAVEQPGAGELRWVREMLHGVSRSPAIVAAARTSSTPRNRNFNSRRTPTMLLRTLLTTVALLSASAASGGDGKKPTSAPAKAAAPALERVVVLGASASAGVSFLEGSKPIAPYLETMTGAAPGAYTNLASELFFMAPEERGEAQAQQAAASKPTLVVAVDFLFWFGYGRLADDAARSALLDKGLKLLEKLDAPVVISDLPDMSAAIGKMLTKAQVPSKECLATLNQKIRTWSAGKKNVVRVDLPGFVDSLRANKAVSLRGNEWPAGSTAKLLLADQLHPTEEGTAALAALALDAATKAFTKELPASAVRWNVKEAVSAVSAREAAASKPAQK